ncbi:MAG: U32 family peptidase, partial [bacterium]
MTTSNIKTCSFKRPELLAPAGEPASAWAALHSGADAIYLGLPRFSARAEAVNVSPDELTRICAVAHAATPRRRVYVTLNTLVTNAELPGVADSLASVAESGADAVIVQDLGVARLVQRHFPELRLHASTQLAVHNLAGACAARDLGFQRVTLARELSLDEIREIAVASGIEVEVFLHGALCYSYSGLCFFSSLLRGHSGNRGRCRYPCRDLFTPANSTVSAMPFSMKDLALPDLVDALAAAGVASLKIEGRKKSPLYVSAVVTLYRGCLDHALSASARAARAADLRTVFSRPWTELYLRGRSAAQVVDRNTVGHRGTAIGRVEQIQSMPGRALPAYGATRTAATSRTFAKPAATDRQRAPQSVHGQERWLIFSSARRLEVHDGIQVDLPDAERPYGFAIEALRPCPAAPPLRPVRRLRTPAASPAPALMRPGKLCFEIPAGARVAIRLPADAPELPVGAALYCSSSQEVKQRYRIPAPSAEATKACRDVTIHVAVAAGGVTAAASHALAGGGQTLAVKITQPGNLQPGRDPAAMAKTLRAAFERLGDTAFRLAGFTGENPDALFVPVSQLNCLRRDLMRQLDEAWRAAWHQRREACSTDLTPVAADDGVTTTSLPSVAWSLRIDHRAVLNAFQEEDWRDLEEVVVNITADPLETLRAGLNTLAGHVGRERIRLALPVITRAWEEAELRRRLAVLWTDGWRLWEGANLDAITRLNKLGANAWSADWTLYATNRMAAHEWLERGAAGLVLSVEDGRENIASLLSEFADCATVIVYQDTPLFISETCARSVPCADCGAPANCAGADDRLKSAHGESVRVITHQGRSITISETPYCL